jgi:hypothetical protein
MEQSWPVAISDHARTSACVQHALPWPELVELLTVPSVHSGDKLRLSAWSPVQLRAGAATRANANVEAVSCLVYDFDRGEPVQRVEALAYGRTAIVHTSFSHKPEHPKLRVVLPLAAPCPAERWADVWGAASRWAASAELTVDAQTKDPGRIFFLPATPPNPDKRRAFYAASQEGELLTWRWLLATYPAPVEPRRFAPVERALRRGLPGQDLTSIRAEQAGRIIAHRCRELAGTGEGGRNLRTFRIAAAAAQLHAAGALDLVGALEDITQAARAAGLGDREIATTIASGVARGKQDGPWRF